MKTILYLLILSVICLNIHSQENLSKDFPQLNKIYQADSKKADYVIVLDQSGSMRKYWDNVKRALGSLIRFLPEDDYISILGFSSKCQPLVIPAKLNSETKNSLIEQVSNLPLPRGPAAQRTDLFEAIDKTLEEINRPNSNELKFLFFLTDYINDPPNNTRWNSTNVHILKEKYVHVVDESERLLKLYALQLPLDVNAGKDYDAFSSIFHTLASPIYLTQNTLVEWFERLRTEIEREKLRLLVEKDLENALTVENISAPMSLLEKDSHFNLTLKNQSKLELNIDSIVISMKDYGTISRSLSDRVIPSDDNTTVRIDLNEEILSLPGLLAKKYSIEVTEIQLVFSAKERVEFGKLNLASTRIYSDSTTREVEIIIGYSYIQVIIVFIITIIILCYLFCACLKPVWLFNKKAVNVSMYMNDQIVELTDSILSSAKNTVSLNNSIIKDPQYRNIFNFRIDFVPRKPKCIINRPKSGTYVYIDSNDSFDLMESLTGETNVRSVGKEFTKSDKPVDFKNGIRIISNKLHQASHYKFEISISTQ